MRVCVSECSGRLSALLDSMLFTNTKSCCFCCCCCCRRRFCCCCCCCRLSMDLRTYQNINMYIFLNTQKRGAPMVNCCNTLSCYLSGSTDHFACCTPLCNFFFQFYPGQCEHATRRITTQFARNQIDLFCTKFYLNVCASIRNTLSR